MSDVGMSHVRCRMYLSNDPKTKCDIWSSGRLTNTFDIVHGTSQHLTLHEQQLNAPLPYPMRGLPLLAKTLQPVSDAFRNGLYVLSRVFISCRWQLSRLRRC